jgi:penicillin-binding protein 2
VTIPALYHTAGSAHLEGIDLAGKTGTAQVMSHQALDKTSKGRATDPNVWFVGVVPRRNPELVVAVLWEHGEFSYYPARLGSRVVAAYVEKQRRLAKNLGSPTRITLPVQQPVEVGAVWSSPDPAAKNTPGEQTARVHTGRFFIDPKKTDASKAPQPTASAAQLGLALSRRKIGLQ